ncbi:hypothetical protein M422DRAFT_34557 [Sphaerobolus stellatus SS14]|uniref:Adenosine deaminase n=1 Tax=Sphaerobolus stellatus (strain SS14) TaxID=990650 RepID=A0A0C9V294_SPHS4|nr:hypothetical protein M422DRAFT_34557 [Sphaerobolus stellatus SS14]
MALDAYWASRASLIAEERSLRRDTAYIANLTESEKKAEEIIRKIRAREAKTVWSVEHEEIPALFPGMEFLTARKLIEETQLFKIFRKMPKGGLLHVHLDATVDTEVLFRIALKHSAIHVRVPGPLAADAAFRPLPEFWALPVSQFGIAADIASSDYVGGTWIPLREARDRCSLGAEVFDDWVIGSMRVNSTEAYKTHNSATKVWQKFFSTFVVSKVSLILFKPVYEEYVYEFLRSSIEDGIMYVEARIDFRFKTMIGDDGEDNVDHAQWVETFGQVTDRIMQELKEQGREDEFYRARIIYTAARFVSKEELEWYLEDCIALKQKFPHIIAGFDLIGDENMQHPLTYHAEPLLRFKERTKELGLDIPFIFHVGQTLGDGNCADQNLFDAILLGTKRIGHGFSMAKHPLLMKICRERGILLEVCPISNEILRLTSSMPMHPLPIFFNNGVPIALSSDDPAVFGNLILSYDYYQVLVSSEVSGLMTLAVTARDSIQFSTLEDSEKRELLQIWERRWKAFVEEICTLTP